jgi:nicotinamide mononucleotide (NMN) deamidase PncC
LNFGLLYCSLKFYSVFGYLLFLLNFAPCFSYHSSILCNYALAHSEATCAIAVTGIAGPGGGTAEKPVGTVFIAWAWKNGDIKIVKKQLAGSRHEIRAQTMEIAIKEML